MADPLLAVRGLHVSYYSSRGTFQALTDVSVELGYGEVFAVVGETGCGKSTFGSAIPRLIPFPGRIDGGEIVIEGENILRSTEEQMREVRRHKVAMIFQDATAALNPVFRIGHQLASSIQVAGSTTRKEVKDETVRLLTDVGIPDAAKVARQYPHQLSGGMKQRVVIAIALARNPKLLIADEPTANLDVTIQAQIVDLIMELRERRGMSILLIAHSMGLVAQMCDRIGVMYAGNLVEVGATAEVFHNPQHPYTRGLLELATLSEEQGHLRTIPGIVDISQAGGDLCSFFGRCNLAAILPDDAHVCAEQRPRLHQLDAGSESDHDAQGDHHVACHLHERA